MATYRIISDGTPGMAKIVDSKTGRLIEGVQDINIHLGMNSVFATIILSDIEVDLLFDESQIEKEGNK